MTKTQLIGRLRHSDGVPYSMVSRAAMQDPTLSLAARGLLALLLTLPEHWQVHADHLAKTYADVHESTLRKHLRELADAGYVIHRQGRRNGGTFTKAELFVRPDPSIDWTFAEHQTTEEHDPDLDPPAVTERGNTATGPTSTNSHLSTAANRSRENRDAVPPHAVFSLHRERTHMEIEQTTHANALDELEAARATRADQATALGAIAEARSTLGAS